MSCCVKTTEGLMFFFIQLCRLDLEKADLWGALPAGTASHPKSSPQGELCPWKALSGLTLRV